MDDLTYELRQLCRRNRDGSHDTQAGRLGGLTLIGKQLRELGFRQMHATSLKAKHVEALVTRWQVEGLSAGTQKNRMSYIRWWAEKVNKSGIIPADDAELAIPDRVFVTNENKASFLDDRLSRITDVYVLMSLRLQAVCKAAGLHRMHGPRHQYAQARYEALTGWKAPAAGGPSTKMLTPEQRAQDFHARQIISYEFGHERLQVTTLYLGR